MCSPVGELLDFPRESPVSYPKETTYSPGHLSFTISYYIKRTSHDLKVKKKNCYIRYKANEQLICMDNNTRLLLKFRTTINDI